MLLNEAEIVLAINLPFGTNLYLCCCWPLSQYRAVIYLVPHMNRERTDYIVVHCSATEPALTIGAREIRDWHRDRGWRDIGYHFVIRRNGTLEMGRAIETQGAHVRGHNHNSVGVCLVGGVDEDGNSEANYTNSQLTMLMLLIDGLKARYPRAKLIGHRDFPEVAKDCPCFDVREWYGR